MGNQKLKTDTASAIPAVPPPAPGSARKGPTVKAMMEIYSDRSMIHVLSDELAAADEFADSRDMDEMVDVGLSRLALARAIKRVRDWRQKHEFQGRRFSIKIRKPNVK